MWRAAARCIFLSSFIGHKGKDEAAVKGLD